MTMSKLAKTMVAAGMVVACMSGAVACSSGSGSAGQGQSGEQGDSAVNQGTAATVYGTDIAEAKVTSQVETVRVQMGLENDQAWAQWLATNNYTPDELREQLLEPFIQRELVRHGAAELGVEVTDEEVDTYMVNTRANFVVKNDDGSEDVEATNEAWQAALAGAGYTEEEYRQTVAAQMLGQRVQTKFSDEAEPTEEDILSAAQMYASYYDGTRRSSHILFDADDRDTAQEVLDQLNAGTITFEDAAKQYSKDGSAANGGDLDWDTGKWVSEFSDALNELDKGEMSGLVESQFGIHIIKCTDIYEAPEIVTSIDQVPEVFQADIIAQATSVRGSSDYSDWLADQRAAAEASGDLVVYPIPDGLSYNVDITPYLTSDPAEGEGAEDVDGEAADGEPDETEGAESEAADGDGEAADAADADAAEAEATAATSEEPAESSAAAQ